MPNVVNNKMRCFILLCSILTAVNCFATITVGPWQKLYPGIYHATGQTDSSESRLQKVNALRIDLQHPEISFFTTPSNGSSPLETTSQNTADFLTQYGLAVAVNANFFLPVTTTPEPMDVHGLAISDFQLVSPNIPVGVRGSYVMLASADNDISFLYYTVVGSLANIRNAIAGSLMLLSNNTILVDTSGTPEPRTAAGTSADGRYLVFITIDGRQDGYSEGATFYETAQWLQRFGATDGINLDGGGSTTMVKAGANNTAVVLNSPSDNPLRLLGNSIGVYAHFVPFEYTPRTLVAYEGFDYPFSQWGTDSVPVPANGGVEGFDGGFGWHSPWHDDLEDATRLTGIAVFPGCESGARTLPLSFTDTSGRKLLTEGNQLRTSAGSWSKCIRYIDLSYVPESYIDKGLLGANGTTMWMSFLAQSYACNSGDRWAYIQLDDNLRLGRMTQLYNWAVWAGGGVVESDICTDQAVMYLVKMDFNSAYDTIKVWLNPPLSHESDLGQPDMTIAMNDLHFSRVAVCGRYSTDFDELRIGTCFEAVTINDPKADLSRDGHVNMADFAILADDWLEQVTWTDIGGPNNWPDGIVDFADLREIISFWLSQ